MAQQEQSPLLDDEFNRKLPTDANMSLTYKVIKTIVMCCLFATESSFVEVIGPILPELVVQTSSSYEAVMRSISMRGLGFVAGGIIGGLTVDRFFEHIDIMMASNVCLYSGVGVSIGYVTDIRVLFVMFLLQGALEQWFKTAAIRLTLKLWKQNSSSALYATHIGSSIAFVITPKVASFFLDPRFSGNIDKTTQSTTVRNSTCSEQKPINTTTPVGTPDWLIPRPKYPADFVYVLWIFAALGVFVAIVFIGYYFHKHYQTMIYDDSENAEKEKDSTSIQQLKESLSPSTCSPTKPTLALLIIIAVFLYAVVSVPVVRIFPKIIFSYARDQSCMTVDHATTLQSTYFIMLAVGRMLAFILSPFIHSKYIMQVSGLGLLISVVTLYIRADNLIVLWAGIAGIGLFVATVVPGLFAVLNLYIEVTSVAILFAQTGAAIGDVLIMYLLGPDYETFGPNVLWNYMLILTVLQFLSVILLQILCYVHGERYQKNVKSAR